MLSSWATWAPRSGAPHPGTPRPGTPHPGTAHALTTLLLSLALLGPPALGALASGCGGGETQQGGGGGQERSSGDDEPWLEEDQVALSEVGGATQPRRTRRESPDEAPRPDPNVQGALPREVIQGVIAEHDADVRACYDPHLEAEPDLAGRIVVAFTIAAGGSVHGAHVHTSTVNNSEVEGCVMQAVMLWSFPDPGGRLEVLYPFDLAPRPEED